jgi:hypothetical protein
VSNGSFKLNLKSQQTHKSLGSTTACDGQVGRLTSLSPLLLFLERFARARYCDYSLSRFVLLPVPVLLSFVMKQNAELAALLHAGSALAGSEDISRTSNTTGILDVLLLRLREYHARRADHNKLLPTSLEEAQLHTALEAFNVVCEVQSLLNNEQHPQPADAEPSSSASTAPEDAVIGTRDLGILRTLLSICFRWCFDVLLIRVSASWPKSHAKTSQPGPNIIDLTSAPADFDLLSASTSKLVRLLYPEAIPAHPPPTWITTTILNRHLPDFLKPCVALGWLPPSIATKAMQPLHEVRPLILHLLSV